MTSRPLVLSVLLLTGVSTTASAAEYSAERFDSHIVVLRGGSVRVVETVVFRFEGRPFTEVFREIRTRRTDGIEVVGAAMDGVPFPRGIGRGQIEITGSSRVRITWRFAPVKNASHTFELTYLAQGIARQDADADVVAWRALPSEHKYVTAFATIDIDLPAAPVGRVSIERHRVEASREDVEGTHVRITAGHIRSNGWIEASVRLPRGSVIETPPQWQQREIAARRVAPMLITVAGLIGLLGAIALFAIHQSYDPPPRDSRSDARVPAIPDTLAPAIAGALVANGRIQLEHGMGALFALADRGEIAIAEQRRSLGQRKFVVSRTPTGRPLSLPESQAIDLIFRGRQGLDQAIQLATARSRLTRRFSRFRRALESEMSAAGLFDEGRKAIRTRYLRLGVATLIVAALLPIPVILVIDQYGPWPMLVSVALLIVGIASLICHAAHTALSNDGVRRATEWRAFRRYLRDVARDRTQAAAQMATGLLPFAVAIGLAPAWSRYLKHHRENVPSWFHAMTVSDSSHAFAAFVATGGAGASSGAH